MPGTHTVALLRRQWDAWWTALLSDRSTAQRWYWAFLGEQLGEPTGGDASGGLLPIGAELSQVLQHLVLAARNWRSAHPVGRRRAPGRVSRDDSLMVTRLVEDIESKIGHRVRPFEYRVEVVPVQGRGSQDLSEAAPRNDAATRAGTMREWRSASAPWFVGVARWRRAGRRVTLMSYE